MAGEAERRGDKIWAGGSRPGGQLFILGSGHRAGGVHQRSSWLQMPETDKSP